MTKNNKYIFYNQFVMLSSLISRNYRKDFIIQSIKFDRIKILLIYYTKCVYYVV